MCYDTDGVSAADLATVGSKLDASAPPLFEPFPGLDDAFREYQRGLRGLVKGILAAVAELLEIDGQELLEGWRHTSSGITVLHYPEEDPDALPTSDGFSGGGRSDTLRFGPAARDDNDGARTDQGANDERAGGDQPTQGDLGASMRAYPHSDGDTMMTILGHDNADGLELLVRGETIAEDRWVVRRTSIAGIWVAFFQECQQ